MLWYLETYHETRNSGSWGLSFNQIFHILNLYFTHLKWFDLILNFWRVFIKVALHTKVLQRSNFYKITWYCWKFFLTFQLITCRQEKSETLLASYSGGHWSVILNSSYYNPEVIPRQVWVTGRMKDNSGHAWASRSSCPPTALKTRELSCTFAL